MSYKDAIECPHCHKTVDLDIEIEGDDGYMNLCPIVIPKKGVIDQHRLQQEIEYHNFDKERGC